MAYEPPKADSDNLPEGSGQPGDRYSASKGAGSPRQADPSNYGTLPASYLTVLTRAKAETYGEEIPNAGWGKTLLGVAIVTLITFGMKLLLAPFTLDNLNKLKTTLASQGQYADTGALKTFFELSESSTSPLLALFVPLTFFGGAALLYVVARGARDKSTGSDTGVSFMTHAYLLSLSYAPLRSIAALAGAFALVPGVDCFGFLIPIGLGIYQLFNVGLSLQASQKLEPGKAQMVAFIPWILGVVLSIVLVILVAVLIAPSVIRG